MITSFEVGAIFKIVNQASPTLEKILKQIRDLNVAIDKAKTNLAELGKPGSMPSLAAATDETKALSTAWKGVAKNAEAARLAIGNASTAAARGGAIVARSGMPTFVGSGMRGGGGAGGGNAMLAARARRGGWGHASVYGPGMGIPGGGNIHFAGRGLGPAAAGAGILGYGAYQAAQMEDAVFQLTYHAGLEQNETNHARFRKVLQDAMVESGYSLKDVAASAIQEVRMFQGTPGGGLDVLPEMLRASSIEARLKGTSPQESMTALIGLAHMTKQYSPEQIKKLAPAFAFLSTANPSSLGSMERAAGYAVPLMQSGLEIDPMTSLLLGTALTRAGAVNTKSGTWLREMALRAMPGTSMMSAIAFKRHEEALKALGLVDDKDKPTWFTGGKPDLFKMLDIASSRAANIPLTERAAYERSLFGAQGGGGFALLADPAVRQQVQALRKEMESPEFKARYGGFMQAYNEGSTVQAARTSLGEFNVLMGDLGKTILPGVNKALQDFKSLLDTIRGVIPGGKSAAATANIGAKALEGGAAGLATGAAIGAFGGPVGAVGGAIIGAGIGGAYGIASEYMKSLERPIDKLGHEAVITGNAASESADKMKALGDAVRGVVKPNGAIFPGGTSQAPTPPVHIQLNIDGKKMGDALSEAQTPYQGFPSQAPAADGVSQSYTGDHQFSSQ